MRTKWKLYFWYNKLSYIISMKWTDQYYLQSLRWGWGLARKILPTSLGSTLSDYERCFRFRFCLKFKWIVYWAHVKMIKCRTGQMISLKREGLNRAKEIKKLERKKRLKIIRLNDAKIILMIKNYLKCKNEAWTGSR